MSADILTRARGEHWYSIFGLVVRSELELPEAILPVQAHQPVENVVEIREEVVPASLNGGVKIADWIEVAGDKCLYRADGICRMLVEGGRSILIDRFPGASDGDVRAFLFGSGLGTIIHQRRLVPIHVSAVRSPIGTLAFTGQSGAGKSTIAAALTTLLGWTMYCDDVAVLHPSDHSPKLHLGTRRNKLWRDAISALGLEGLEMARDVSRFEKFHLLMGDDLDVVAPPIAHLFELNWGEEVSIREISPSNRFALSMNAVYRPYLSPIFGDTSVARQVALSMSRHLRGFVLTRPRRLSDIGSVIDALRTHVLQHA